MTLSHYILIKGQAFLATILGLIKSSFFINLIAILISIYEFYLPVYPIMALIFFAVIVDTISGLCKALKFKRRITSWKFRDMFIKIFLYESLVLILYGVEITCLWCLPLSKFIGAFIIFAESISISENVDEISNGKLGLAAFIRRLKNKWLKNNK